MSISITKELLGAKTAECNEIIIFNIKLIMNIKAPIQLLKKKL